MRRGKRGGCGVCELERDTCVTWAGGGDGEGRGRLRSGEELKGRRRGCARGGTGYVARWKRREGKRWRGANDGAREADRALHIAGGVDGTLDPHSAQRRAAEGEDVCSIRASKCTRH